jgi:hypothetical protein
MRKFWPDGVAPLEIPEKVMEEGEREIDGLTTVKVAALKEQLVAPLKG